MNLNKMGSSIFILFGIIASIFSLLFVSISQGAYNLKEGKMTWGYEEVRPGANIFWWLYFTQGKENYLKVPLVLWLQGGPGASGTGFGNFMEIGPLDVNLKNRSTTWVNNVNVLFVDSPVGTGFSYANDTKLLATNNTQISIDLVSLLVGFFKKVPEFQTIPLYIFSESYGGKMAIQFALRLSKAVQKGKIQCNLKGVSLGDSWISPIDSVLTWAPFLFSTSLVDNTGFAAINASAYKVKDAVDKGDFIGATNLWDETENVITKATNGVSFYNIMETSVTSTSQASLLYSAYGHKHLAAFHTDKLSTLMNGEIKQMLRVIPVNVTWGGQSKLVFDSLKEDFMKPITQVVEAILNNTSIAVSVYTGQLDLIVDTIGTTRWVERLRWMGIPFWKNAKRLPIILNNSTAGFVKSFKNFNFYWILKAGHMIPADAPETGVEILQMMTGLKKIETKK